MEAQIAPRAPRAGSWWWCELVAAAPLWMPGVDGMPHCAQGERRSVINSRPPPAARGGPGTPHVGPFVAGSASSWAQVGLGRAHLSGPATWRHIQRRSGALHAPTPICARQVRGPAWVVAINAFQLPHPP